ncbi:type IV secretory system conjugative DNA transfer family protein [Thiosulfatihalobacter marinus]|uniref:type IV secretory system conjugative DNA transfer family protein n=1 Tax=Thiosulfatihalobacter marinus TaxID=2792481 RepID=UPI001E4702E9|nr:type IV secretion system DNA-binding domain-containing protein [Thiosulfatihalobacter marinus]
MHTYVVGQTGTGKSTLLMNMAIQDNGQRIGFALVDPHGDLAETLSGQMGDQAHVWNVADPTCHFGYNPLTKTSPALRPLIASGLIETLKKQWADAWGVRMEHLLRHAILALLDTPKTDLRDIIQIFLDREFRKQVLVHVRDEQVRQFWTEEYPAMNYKNATDGLAPIANKLGAFLAHPIVRKAICEPEEPLRFRQIMDQGQILIVNLAKGRLGSDIANVLGGLIVSGVTHAAFSRHDLSEAERRPFFLYVDEFHSFTTEAVADLLSETRKYKLGVILSQQHTGQNDHPVFASVMGNVGTMICFRIGASDAPLLSAQLGKAEIRDLINQPNHRAFVRMMIDGQPSKAFTMTTFPPLRRDLND